MAAYRRVYDSRHLQADCQEAGGISCGTLRSAISYGLPFYVSYRIVSYRITWWTRLWLLLLRRRRRRLRTVVQSEFTPGAREAATTQTPTLRVALAAILTRTRRRLALAVRRHAGCAAQSTSEQSNQNQIKYDFNNG